MAWADDAGSNQQDKLLIMKELIAIIRQLTATSNKSKAFNSSRGGLRTGGNPATLLADLRVGTIHMLCNSTGQKPITNCKNPQGLGWDIRLPWEEHHAALTQTSIATIGKG